MRATILPKVIILTKAHRAAVSIMANFQGVYCGLRTQLYLCLYNYNAIFFKSLHQGSIATGKLSGPNTPLSSLPVGNKWTRVITNILKSLKLPLNLFFLFLRPKPQICDIFQNRGLEIALKLFGLNVMAYCL